MNNIKNMDSVIAVPLLKEYHDNILSENNNMKLVTLLSTLILVLLLASCGGDDGGENAPAGKTPENIFDPWVGVGEAGLPDGMVTSSVRALEFGDGMGISYDGSDQSGEEEVCRRERDPVGWYEICMPLEDQPYFVALESKAFVWHPLLFDRFATELICRTWMEGDEVKALAECDVVLPRFGEEDFRCEAGVVNGDKALRCSDDWAVVVNGESDDTKTLCRVHIDQGSGRCLGAPREGVSDRALILEMQRSSWDGYRSGQDNPRQFVPGEALTVIVPQDLPVGAKLSYHSRDEEICTVDDDDSDGGMGGGVIMNVSPPATCRIVLKIEARGYADRVLVARLPILKSNDTAWGDYAPSTDGLYLGETLAAQAVSSTAPASPILEYISKDESICTVDGKTGEITAVGLGACRITLTARAEDYLDRIIHKQVAVSALKQFTDIVWNFPDTAVVGVDSAPIAAPTVLDGDGNTVTDSNLVVSVAHKSGDCTYNSSARTLSFGDIGECVMEVSASGVRGYTGYAEEFAATPTSGTLGLTWTGYASLAPKLSDAPPGLILPTVTSPADGNGVEYAYSARGVLCDVDAATGVLTLKSVGSCAVTVTADRSGYNAESVNVSVVIGQGEQDLTVPSNPYGGVSHLGAGRRLSLENFPEGGYGILVFKSKNASDDCTVAGLSDASNRAGDIVAGLGGTGTCTIQAQWSGNFQYAPSAWTDIAVVTMVASAQTFTWQNYPYGANPTIAVGAALNIVTASTGGVGGIEYKSLDSTLCTVAADGTVTGRGVGDCTVAARWKGNSTAGASNWANIPAAIAVTKGVGPTDLSALNAYGASASLAVGESLEVVSAPDRYGTVTYSIKAGSETYCRVDSATGSITAAAVGDCIVEVNLAGTPNHEPSVALLQTIGVTPGSQVITFSEPYGAEPTVASGESLGIITVPISNAGGTLSYRVKSGSEAYCSVTPEDGTVTGVGVGECTIEVSAAAVLPNYGAGEWVEIVTITVEAGILSGIDWRPGFSRGKVGEELTLRAVDTGDSGATVSYQVREGGKTGCAFAAADQNDATAERTLTFLHPGGCKVAALAEKNDYVRWEREHTIWVGLGTFELEDGVWGAFPSGSLVVSGSSMTPVRSEAIPVGVSIGYGLLRGERDCRLVNYRTGEVSALPVPLDRVGEEIVTKCSIVGIARKKGYRLLKSPPIEIVLGQGQIRLRSLPRYIGMRINPEGTVQLSKGGVLTLEEDGHPKPLGRYGVEVSYFGRGYAAGTENEKPDVCAVDEITGEMVAGEAAGKGDICRLTVTVVDPIGSHEDLEETLDFIIAEGTLNFTSAPVLNYGNGAKLKIGVSTPLTPTGLPEQDNSSTPVSVKWKYEVSGLAAELGTSKQGVCRVDGRLQIEKQSNMVDNPDYGKIVLGTKAGNGDTCRIQAYATAPGYTWYEGVDSVEFVVEGHQLLFAGGSGTKPAYPDELRLTGTAAPDTLATADDNNVDVVWGSFTAVGDDVDGSDATDGGVCSVDPVTGVVTLGDAASVNDTCTVTGVASAATAENYDHSAALELVDFTIAATGTFASVASPGYDPDGLQVGGDPLPFTTAPAVTPADVNGGVIWVYEAEGKRNGAATEDICRVDGNSGTVAPGSDAQSGDTCEITTTATANGYAGKSAATVVLTVKVAFQSLAWDTFPSAGTVGVPIDLNSNRPVSTPPANSYSIAIDSGDCDYTAGVLTFTDTSECVVGVTASKDNHISKKSVFRLTPTAGAITLGGAGWGSYDVVTVGGTPVAAPVLTPTPTDATKTYTSLTGTVCSVSNTGVVEGLDDEACAIKLVLSHTGYSDLEHTYRFTVQTGILPAISWGTFQGGGLQVGGSSRTPSAPTGISGATFVYKLKQGSAANCALEDTATGEVRAKAVDLSSTKTCIIIGTAGKTGYADKTSGDISINLAPGTQPSITWGQFSGTLKVGSGTKTPATTSATGATIAYALKAGNTNCTLVNANTGQVRARAVDLSSTKKCTIVGTATRTGYNDKTSGDISINLSAGTQGAVSWGAFSGTLKVGGANKAPTAATGAGVSAATITYALKSGSEANCTLTNANTGAVSALAVDLSSTKTCIVIGTATRTGYTTKTSGDISINLAPGTQPAITWGNFGGNTLQVGGATQTPTTTTATGVTIGYALKQGSSTNCELVTASSGEVRAKAVDLSSTKVCTIVGTATRTGYTTVTSGDISINLSLGNMGELSAPDYGENTLAIGGSAAVVTAPGGVPDGASWAYAVTASCTIVEDTGVVTSNSDASEGDTCIVTATASADGYNAKAAPTVTLTVTSDEALAITWSGYTPATLTWASGGVSAPTLSAPTVADDDGGAVTAPAISFAYAVGDSTTNNACTVTAGTGAVAIAGAGTCHIVLTVADAAAGDNINYVTTTASSTITVNKAANSAAVTARDLYAATVTVGVPITPTGLPTDGDGTLSYRVWNQANPNGGASGDDCTVNTSTGELAGAETAVGENCHVHARWSGDDDHLESNWFNISGTSGIRVNPGTITGITWSPASTGVVGTPLVLDAVGGSGLANGDRVTYTKVSGSCAFGSGSARASRTLIFTNTGNCVVKVGVARTGYAWESVNKTIAVSAGTIAVAGADTAAKWGTYPAVTVGESAAAAPTIGTTTPGTVTKAYTSGTNCEVETNGAVTGLDDGTCSITLTLSATGYSDKTHTYTVTVNEGTLGTLTGPAYSGSLRAGGGSLSVSTAPGGTPQGVSVTWSYAAVGKRGSTVTQNICSVNSGNGQVTTGSAATSGDTCEITATATATGYAVKAAPITTLTVALNQLPRLVWDEWDDLPTEAVAVGIVINPPTWDTTPYIYGVNESYTMDTPTVCYWEDEEDPYEIETLAGGTCEFTLTLSKAGYEDATHTYTFEVVLATMGTLTPPVYGSSQLGAGGGGQTPTTPPGGAPEGATWAYSAVGKRSGTVTANICSVASDTGLVRALSTAQSGDTCEVTATASASGHEDKAAAAVTFDILGGIALTWTGYASGNVKLSDTAPGLSTPSVTLTPTSGSTVALAYSVHTDTTRNSCTVDASTGALSLQHAGRCVIQLIASLSGYKSAAATFTVTVAKGVQDPPSWRRPESFNHHYGITAIRISVGESYSLLRPPTGGGGHGSLRYETSDGGGCTVDSNTGAIRAVNGTSNKGGRWCRLYAYWSGNADYRYSDWNTAILMWVVPGTIAVGDWGEQATLNVGSHHTLAPTGIVPADATKAWTLAEDSAGCTVNDSGRVSGTAAGTDNCKVVLTLTKNHYNTKMHTYTISITAP